MIQLDDDRGEVGEDPTATCEPFFVPRQPVFEDEVILINAGGWLEISFRKQKGMEELNSQMSREMCS